MKLSEIELRNTYDNRERDLLRCPHCGQLLEEVISRRLEYVIESYTLFDGGLECDQSIDSEYYDDCNHEFFCAYCDEELDRSFIEKLDDEGLISIF